MRRTFPSLYKSAIDIEPCSHGMEKPPTDGGNDFFTLAAVVLRPKSVGSVTLTSSDVFDAPLIDPNYLSDTLDRKVRTRAGS